MSKVTVFVFANQNEVSEKEASKIKHAIESANGIQVDVVANATLEQVESHNGKTMIFETKDENNNVYARQVSLHDADVIFNGNKVILS